MLYLMRAAKNIVANATVCTTMLCGAVITSRWQPTTQCICFAPTNQQRLPPTTCSTSPTQKCKRQCDNNNSYSMIRHLFRALSAYCNRFPGRRPPRVRLCSRCPGSADSGLNSLLNNYVMITGRDKNVAVVLMPSWSFFFLCPARVGACSSEKTLWVYIYSARDKGMRFRRLGPFGTARILRMRELSKSVVWYNNK